MLATAQVRILAEPGMSSQLNLITHDCMQRLHLHYTPASAAITGIGGANAMYAFGFIDTWIQHRTFAEPLILIRLLVVSRILARLSARKVRTPLGKLTDATRLNERRLFDAGSAQPIHSTVLADRDHSG